MSIMRTKLLDLKIRADVKPKTKYFFSDTQASHLTGVKKKKLYDYYVCDYCGDEIIVEKEYEKRTGGIIILPDWITKKGNIKVALCNKCLKPVLKEFEDEKE